MAASLLVDGATALKTFIFQKYEKYYWLRVYHPATFGFGVGVIGP